MGELAAMRVPDLAALAAEPVKAPTLREAADTWRASRVDVAEGTRVLHRVALERAMPLLGDRPVDELEPADVARLVEQLAANGKKRETIRKTVKYLAAVLDENGRDPNPARDRRIRLPHEEHEELTPPTADHVAAAVRLLAPGVSAPAALARLVRR